MRRVLRHTAERETVQGSLMVFSLNVPPRPRPQFAIRPERIEPTRLTDIIHRADVGMNPEGAALLYPQDVGALLGEIMFLRHQVDDALDSLRHMPIPQDADLETTALRAAQLWDEMQSNIWQKTQMRTLRQRVSDAEETLRREREAIDERSRAIDAQTAAFVRDEERRVLERKEISRLQARVSELEQERRLADETHQSRVNALRELLESDGV